MVVIDHAGLRARLLHDGVGEVLARGAAQVGELEVARKADLAIGLIRRGGEHLAVGVLQLERVLAALQLGVVREARRDRNDLGRRQLHGSLCGVGVREGGGIGLVTIVGNGGVQLASFVHDLHHGVVHRVVEGHVGQVALLLHDGVLVLAGLGVVDGREGDGTVLAVLGGLDGLLALQLLSRQIALVQVEGELAALERSRRAIGLHVGLLRRERHRGPGGLVLVGEGRHGLIAVVGNGCAQRAVLVIGDADLDLHFPSVVDDGLVVTGNFLDGVLVVTGLGVVDGLEGNVAVLVVRDGLNGRAFRLVTLVQSEREFVPRERTARKELLRRQGHGTLRGIAVGEHQLVVFGQRAVEILRGNRARDAIAFFSQIRGTLLAAGQLIARGHLVLAGQLPHRVLVALAKIVHANRLVGLDSMGVAVLQIEHVAGLLSGPSVLEHCGLVRLPLGHGELEGELRVLIARQASGHVNLLRHLEARLAFVRHAHAGGARKQGVQIHVAQIGAGALRISDTRLILRDAHTYPARLGLQAVGFALLGGPILVDTSVGAVLEVHRVAGTGGIDIAPRKITVIIFHAIRCLPHTLDPRERVVDVALCAKLAQALHKRARPRERRDIVIGRTSIGMDAVIVHNHLGERVVKQEALGRRDLL